MSRPSNWSSMSAADRSAWESAEYDRDEAVRAEERSRTAARRAQQRAAELVKERDQVADQLLDEIDDVRADLAEERDRYCAASLRIDLIVVAVRRVQAEMDFNAAHPAWVALIDVIADQGPPLDRIPGGAQ